MAQLRYIDDSGQLQTKVLDAEPCVIGRAPTCQVVLVDDTISREHVRIEMESGGRYRIKDLGSRNKTHVNGEAITETILHAGDIIRAGGRVFEFLDEQYAPRALDMAILVSAAAEPPDCEWVKIKAPLALKITQLERLASLQDERRVTARAEDLADSILAKLLLDLHAERGFVALRGESKLELRPIAHRGIEKATGSPPAPISQPFALAPVLQSVAGRYPKITGQLDPKLGYAITALVAPLTYRGEIMGVLYIDRAVAKKPFTTDDLQYALGAGAVLGTSIAELSRDLVRLASREGAAWIASLRRVQQALSLPIASSESLLAAGRIYPGRARCGDFLDVVHLDELRACAVAIDGGGHGMIGLAQSASIRSAIRAALFVSEEVLLDPAALFNPINTMLAASRGRQPIACTYVGIDLAVGRASYICAGGMSPMLMIAPGRLVTLDHASLVLGVDGDYLYENTEVDLPEGFRLVCHTDGLIEGTNGSGEPLGRDRLHDALLEKDAFATAEAVLSRVDNVWTTHLAGAQPDDDAAVLVVSRG